MCLVWNDVSFKVYYPVCWILVSNQELWYCSHCITDMFPFNQIADDTDYISAIEDLASYSSLSYLSDKLFLPFELNDDDHMTNFCNADPDLNFYNSLNQYASRCNYYLESTFNNDMETYPCANGVLSMCCFNIRSIKRNLTSFESYLDLLNHQFTLIGITETWLRDDDCDLYNISNYIIVENLRQDRSGGGVALFVQNNVKYSVRHDLETFDHEFESLFIEIDKGQLNSDKTVIVGVVYRPPNTSIDSFNMKISGIMDILKKETIYCYLTGDFNINILNSDNHDLTAQFVDIMISNAFLPLITRPTRVTANSAPLIDNIFTNNFDNITQSVHGIYVTDILDHYPVFCINRGVMIPETEEIIFKRIYSSRNKQAFLTGIQEIDWGSWMAVMELRIVSPSFIKSWLHCTINISH